MRTLKAVIKFFLWCCLMLSGWALVFIIFTLSITTADASEFETYYTSPLASWHANKTPNSNTFFIDGNNSVESVECEINLGLGGEIKSDNVYVGANVFQNSFCNTSTYAYIGYDFRPHSTIGYGIEAGYVTGYSRRRELAQAPWIAVPFIRVDNFKFIIVPSKDPIVALTVLWRF